MVAIIALLAAIAVPNFLRARKRSQASRVLEDLRMLDAAIDQYAMERNKKTGDAYSWNDLLAYIKPGTALYNSNDRDILGNPHLFRGVGEIVLACLCLVVLIVSLFGRIGITPVGACTAGFFLLLTDGLVYLGKSRKVGTFK